MKSSMVGRPSRQSRGAGQDGPVGGSDGTVARLLIHEKGNAASACRPARCARDLDGGSLGTRKGGVKCRAERSLPARAAGGWGGCHLRPSLRPKGASVGIAGTRMRLGRADTEWTRLWRSPLRPVTSHGQSTA
jgi:hypothetical protein